MKPVATTTRSAASGSVEVVAIQPATAPIEALEPFDARPYLDRMTFRVPLQVLKHACGTATCRSFEASGTQASRRASKNRCKCRRS